jgi:multiple sugar transport system substrate-binding protein
VIRQTRLVVGFVLLPLLAACGGVGGSDDTGGPDGSGGGPGGVVDTMGFSLQDVIASTRVQAVEDAHPGLRVEVAEGGFDEQQFLSSVASGEPPSAVYLEREDLGTYAARGALTPLDECIESQDIDLEQYRESALEQVTYDDQIYGIPEFFITRVLLVNADAMRQIGTAPQEVDTGDWPGLADMSRQLVRRGGGGLERIGFDPKIPEFFPLWVEANGGELVSDDGLEVALNSDEAVEALEYTVSLVRQNGTWAQFQAFRDTWDFFGAQNEFVADQVGAFPMEDWYLDVLAEVAPKTPAVAVPFRDRSGEPLAYASGQAWAIPKGAANPDGACAFVQAMTAADTWVAAAEASKRDRESSGGAYLGTFTGNVVADEQIFERVWEPTGNANLDDATRLVREVQDDSFGLPASPAGAEVKKAWEDAVLRALEGEQTPAQALDQAQREAEDAIAKADG